MTLTLENLVLNYSYKSVLKNVSTQFFHSSIHGILGENGAGKSSLAKILYGEITPSEGKIFCDDKQIFPAKNYNTKSALQMGICYVHQRPLLAENATIYENVILGLKKIDKKQINLLIKKWLPNHQPSTLVKDIGGDCNFFTALICALLKNPKVLILDEPCALLDESQTDFLYSNLRTLAENGMNIIVITHSKKEAQKFCDTITILKDGKIDFSDNEKKLKWEEKFLNENYQLNKIPETQKSKTKTSDFIEFSNLWCKPVNRPAIANVSFCAKAGEITLVSGLVENGLETLENVICGMEKSKFSGKLIYGGSEKQTLEIKNRTYNTKFLRNNLKKSSDWKTAIIPSDKNFRGSNPNLTIKQLLSFSSLSCEELIKKAEINISEKEKVLCLSGGMLQRLILQRELSINPQILIFCEPLQGLDFAASEKICDTLKLQADEGKIVLILSASDFPENLCHKIYKLKSGKIVEEK